MGKKIYFENKKLKRIIIKTNFFGKTVEKIFSNFCSYYKKSTKKIVFLHGKLFLFLLILCNCISAVISETINISCEKLSNYETVLRSFALRIVFGKLFFLSDFYLAHIYYCGLKRLCSKTHSVFSVS